ncbi:MAG: serine O-acetyltransferase [Rhodothalassiaceae bacterium]
MRRDLWRWHGRASTGLLIRAVLARRTFRPLFWLRVHQAFKAAGGPWRLALPLAWLMHRWSCSAAGLELPLSTRIGPGLRILHGFGLVVNEKAEIGENVTLFHGVTIGQRDKIAADGRTSLIPRIGDGALIGAYAQILGAQVGAGATVAPLSLVREAVPDRAVVAGNPARVVREDAPADIRHLMERDIA